MNIIDSVLNHVNAHALNAKNWIIAYSGGVDSCVLADILYKIKPSNVKLKIIHVNHGLGQEEAKLWVEQAKNLALSMNAEFITTELNMDETLSGVESRARKLRHEFISSHIGKDDIVFMGHHKNDQAETLLFRLCRGTGIRGLMGIPSYRDFGEGKLLRPLINVSRKEIVDHALDHGISWFEDDTNIDLQFSRNFMRHKVIPLLSSRWSNIIDKLEQLSKKAEESYLLSNEIALLDLETVSYYENEQLFLSCEKISKLSYLRQKNLINYYIETILEVDQETSKFENTLKVLLSENKNCSKFRKLLIKNWTIYTNGVKIYALSR